MTREEAVAEALAEHRYMYGKGYSAGRVEVCACGWETPKGKEDARAWEALAAHQAEQLAANGYGKLEDVDKGELRRVRDYAERMDALAEERLIRANAAEAKLEDAWEAGRRAGYDAGSRWARTGEDKDTPNPYRRPE